jgi:DNA-binding ferritin-like protein (Dps family)
MSNLSVKQKISKHHRSSSMFSDLRIKTPPSDLSITNVNNNSNQSFSDNSMNHPSILSNKGAKIFELTHINSYSHASTMDQTPLETPKELSFCPSSKERSTRGSFGFSFKETESCRNSQVIALKNGGLWGFKREEPLATSHKRIASNIYHTEYVDREKSVRIGDTKEYKRVFQKLDSFVKATDDNTALLKHYCKNYKDIQKHITKLGIGNRENIHRANTKLNLMEKASVERYVNLKKKENTKEFMRSILLPRVKTAAAESKRSLMLR